MELRNLHEQMVHGTMMVIADFKVADGRKGSVSVEKELFDQHGEVLLMQQAEGYAAMAARNPIQQRGYDRFAELL